MGRDKGSRSLSDQRRANSVVGTLKIPGPDITRRENKSNSNARGSRRSAQEIFNRTYARWKNVEYSGSSSSVQIDAARCRQIKKKIRNALYHEGPETIEQGKLSYREAAKLHGSKLYNVKKRLDGAYPDLELAEDSWAADLFIQDVF